MKLGAALQQPTETIDYEFDYGSWFGSAGDVITEFTAVSTPVGLSLVNLISSDTVGKVWVTGGTDNVTYLLTVTATTTSGRVKEDELEIFIQDVQ
jgi:hypothetical protein